MKSLIFFALLLPAAFASAKLDLAGTNILYSNTSDLAYKVKLETSGTGSILTADGESPIVWSQINDNSINIKLIKPTAYVIKKNYFDKNLGKNILIELSYKLESLQVDKYADDTLSIKIIETVEAPLAPQLNKTYLSVEDVVQTTGLYGEFQITDQTDQVILPSTNRLNDMMISLKNGVIIDAADEMKGKKFSWGLNSNRMTLSLYFEDGTTLHYSLAGIGEVPRTIGVATMPNGAQKLLSGRSAIGASVQKATMQTFAGAYETVSLSESMSEMPIYQFNINGTGGFVTVDLEDGLVEPAGLYTYPTFWMWTVDPQGVITATQYRMPNGTPVQSADDLQFCITVANSCSPRQVRTHTIIGTTDDGLLITLRKLQGFVTETNPDGTTKLSPSEAQISLWVLRKI